MVAAHEAGAEKSGLMWLGLDVFGTARCMIDHNKV